MRRICKWKRKPAGAPEAHIAIDYIEDIKRKRGGITSQLLVIEASKKDSPLHDCFEWDETKAAGQWRIEQGRLLLKNLIVAVIEDEEEEPIYVRCFISPIEVEEKGGTSYLTIKEICNDEELNEAYLRQLKNELHAFVVKIENYVHYRKTKSLQLVVKAIKKVKI